MKKGTIKIQIHSNSKLKWKIPKIAIRLKLIEPENKWKFNYPLLNIFFAALLVMSNRNNMQKESTKDQLYN